MKETLEKKIRLLLSKPGSDGHDRGATVLAVALRDAGIEVIYTGLYQTSEMIVNAAIEEDVDVIALSNLGSSHIAFGTEIMELLKKKGASHICVIGGGIITEKEKPVLEKIGVTGNYGPGTPIDVIVNHINQVVKERDSKIVGKKSAMS